MKFILKDRKMEELAKSKTKSKAQKLWSFFSGGKEEQQTEEVITDPKLLLSEAEIQKIE